MKKNIALLLSFLVLALVSCSPDYEIKPSFESIILTADSSSKLVGETITLTVTNNTGDVLTDDATIYVDGNAIDGNTFTSDAVGSHTITATYESAESEPLTVTFSAEPQVLFRKRVLIEDYTGTWCGYCPRVAHAIELVQQQTEYAVAVAIHRPSSSSSSPVYDPYNFPGAEELEGVIGLAGYPNGMLNRMTQWTTPEPNNVGQAIALTQGENPKTGLAMASTVSGNSISLDVKVKFSKDFSNLKLVVYVLENGLIYDQKNYTTFYGGVSTIPNFVHNHTLRACLTPIMGEAISNSETVDGNTYSRSFNVPVPANVANAGKIEFVAFVVDAQGNAVNVRKAARDENQDFEEL